MESRTLHSTSESGYRAGYEGSKKRNGTNIHMAVDTLGNLITVVATPANEQDPAQVSNLCLQVQEVTVANVKLAYADQRYIGDQTALDAAERGVEGQVIKPPTREQVFILLPSRWIIGGSFARTSRFRPLGRNLERLSSTLIGFHFVAGCILLLNKLHPIFGSLAG